MIIVKNREMLIPDNERYIGTTYDDASENRQFLVPRFAQNGVDLSALVFRLDFLYANGQRAADTVTLSKVVSDENITLTWTVSSAQLEAPGTLIIQIRAIDGEATVKWSSYQAALYIARHLNTPGNYTGSLSEIEQMENDHEYMLGIINELNASLDYTSDAEAWAVGTRKHVDEETGAVTHPAVGEDDETYHNNSKYHAEMALYRANQAGSSANAAAASATQAAETVADTNTRFDNAVSAVTVNTEVQDARVGADGTTYTVLKNRLDAEHDSLKDALNHVDVNNLAKYVYLANENAVTTEENTIITSQSNGAVVHGTNANFSTLRVDLTAVNGTLIQSELYQKLLSVSYWIFTVTTDTDGYLWAINVNNLETVTEVGLTVNAESITFDLSAIMSTYPNAKYLYICMEKTQAVDFIITKGIILPEWIIPNAKDVAYTNGSDAIATDANATNVWDALEAHSGKIVDNYDSVVSVLTSDAADMSIMPNLTYQNGYVHGLAYGSPHASTNTIYSNLVSAETSVINIDIASGYKALVVEYTESGEYVNMGSWLTGQSTRTLTSARYCIEIRNSENTNIDTSVASNVQVSYSKPIMPGKRKVVNITADSTEMLSITESCDIIGNGHTINVGENAQYALYIYGNIEVNISNLKMVGGTTAACRVGGYALANFNNCEFNDSTGHGLSTANGSTNCTDCIATGNGTDGFNYHATGKNTAISCWGYDNGDDGISNHEQSTLKIIGGRYTGNAKAGIACPTYGAGNTDIHGAYIANNAQYGLLIFAEEQTNEQVFVEGCLVLNNPIGVRVSGYQVIAKGVAFSGNATDKNVMTGGSITEY